MIFLSKTSVVDVFILCMTLLSHRQYGMFTSESSSGMLRLIRLPMSQRKGIRKTPSTAHIGPGWEAAAVTRTDKARVHLRDRPGNDWIERRVMRA
jgi:hypothetical protein